MEIFGVIVMPFWVILLICCTYLIYRYSIHPFNVWKDHGVDGPHPTPFFGNILDVYNPKVGSRACIEKWQAKYGRICGIYFFRKPVLVVTDPEMLKQIFVKQFYNFTDRFFIGDGKLNNRIIRNGVFFEYGNAWQRIRRIMTPTFSSGKLKQLVHYVNKTAYHLSEKSQKNAVENTCIDAKDFFGAFAIDVIGGLAFGLDINSQSKSDLPFIKNAKSLLTFKMLARLKLILGGTFPAIIKIYELFDIGFFNRQNCHYFEQNIYSLISERKDLFGEGNQVDFLQLLLNAEAEEDGYLTEKKLSSKEVASQCIMFIIAGYETTSSALQYISYELSRNKSVQDKVWEEIQLFVGDTEEPTYDQISNLRYMSAVISEGLRMYPPVHLISRQAEKACTLNGVSIPAKAGILIPVFNIGRDPSLFEEPDVFNPERFLKNDSHPLSDISFLPFGYGPRHCIGMRLALIEIKLALTHMLRKVTIKDASPKVLQLEDFSGLLVPAEPIKLYVDLK